MGLFDSARLSCDLKLERSIFFPGNVITGQVAINVSSPASFVAIRLVATGEEFVRVSWTESIHHDDGRTTYETRSVEETNPLYKQVVTLAGQMESSGSRYEQQLPVGNFSYPFQLTLPTTLPPSMQSNDGDLNVAIRYKIEAVVDVANGFDKASAQTFTVLAPIPAMQWATAAPMAEHKDLDITCCCCISKGNVKVNFFANRTTLALDRDTIEVFAGVDNTKGEEPVEAFNVELVNRLAGRARGREARSETVIASAEIKQRIAPGNQGEIRGVVKLKPLANPTCSSMNIFSQCVIRVSIDIPWASDPEWEFPVVVAHSVDDSNFLPPRMLTASYLGNYSAAIMPEVYYVPPPTIPQGWQVQMMPFQAPAGAMMWQPPQAGQVYNAAPSAYFTGGAQVQAAAPSAYAANAA